MYTLLHLTELNECNFGGPVGQGKKRIMTSNWVLLSRMDHIYMFSLRLNSSIGDWVVAYSSLFPCLLNWISLSKWRSGLHYIFLISFLCNWGQYCVNSLYLGCLPSLLTPYNPFLREKWEWFLTNVNQSMSVTCLPSSPQDFPSHLV